MSDDEEMIHLWDEDLGEFDAHIGTDLNFYWPENRPDVLTICIAQKDGIAIVGDLTLQGCRYLRKRLKGQIKKLEALQEAFTVECDDA